MPMDHVSLLDNILNGKQEEQQRDKRLYSATVTTRGFIYISLYINIYSGS